MGKIFHIDDDPDWLKWVRNALEPLGHSIFSFSTLSEADEAVSKQDFDVYICDVNLSEKDGDELGYLLARQLQKEGHKIIILSSIQPSSSISVMEFVDKTSWIDGEKERLGEIIKKMLKL